MTGRVNRPEFDKLVLQMDEQMDLYLRIPERVKKRLEARGLEPMPRPRGDRPYITKSISQMTNEELGDIQGDFAVWEAYIGEVVGEVETDVSTIKAARKALLSAIKDELANQNVPTSARADRAQADTRFEHMDARWTESSAELKELKAMLEGLQKQREACSRYVTIRKTEIETHTRNENIRKSRGSAKSTMRRAFK